ncbi:MAG: hypothetical protein EBS01_14850, partial [Verrucomicrobia bacterium]|nr:hypothetical protein [Verrucomicrobiota bacterium]
MTLAHLLSVDQIIPEMQAKERWAAIAELADKLVHTELISRDHRQEIVNALEAREHTAQVESERREVREKRFRFGDRERQELANDATLRDLGESSRFLPVLFCSPTMELGVDIADLNAIRE